MKGFLLDTNVVSEAARPVPSPSVIAFLADRNDLWLSAIVLHELEYGAGLIAGTAAANDLTLATRNVDDFAPFDIEVLNPWIGSGA